VALLFADEDFPYEIVQALSRLGHDATTTREAGLANRGTGDPEILRIATAGGRAVLTRNRRHFMRLHMQQPDHAGIIVCTVDSDFERQAQRVHAAISTLGSLAGRLIRVYRPGPGELGA
jgi:predicted nuclease of predicted toxin-antitoxin system